MDIQRFLNSSRSMVCAPAGYGKTYTIAQCVAANISENPALILTHTNAGVHSIRKKIQDAGIEGSRYELSTICGFQEWLVSGFVKDKSVIPVQSDETYYKRIQELAIKVAKTAVVQKILSLQYSHIFVDEFQDCSLEQLQFIDVIGRQLPVHVLGDPLQSIYNFKDISLDMNGEESRCYTANCQTLETPWRWINAGSVELGQELHIIRQRLLSGEEINLNNLQSIRFCQYPEVDKYKPKTNYSQLLWRTGKFHNGTVVLLAPVDEQYNYRVKLVQRYKALTVLESVEDKDFYAFACKVDNLTSQSAFGEICRIALECMKKQPIRQFVKQDGNLVKKRNSADEAIAASFSERKSTLESNFSLSEVLATFDFLERLPDMQVYRRHIIHDLETAISKAIRNQTSVYEAMSDLHNKRKRIGLPVMSKHIGTSLLTKGLEFDHVIVLDAHKFSDARNFYVAITRGCKSVTIISEKATVVCGQNYSLHWK